MACPSLDENHSFFPFSSVASLQCSAYRCAPSPYGARCNARCPIVHSRPQQARVAQSAPLFRNLSARLSSHSFGPFASAVRDGLVMVALLNREFRSICTGSVGECGAQYSLLCRAYCVSADEWGSFQCLVPCIKTLFRCQMYVYQEKVNGEPLW